MRDTDLREAAGAHLRRVEKALVVAGSLTTHSTLSAEQSAVQCKPTAALQRLAELPEGSGLAASRRTPGRFRSHNDSGDPVLFALDRNGRVVERLSISGAAVEDWDAIDSTMYLMSEGGGKKQPGAFARLTCRLSP